LLAVTLASAATTASAQSAAAAAFEVASVRRNTSGSTRSDWDREPGGGVKEINVTLRHLIRGAYSLRDAQITGGPSWLDTDRFDVVAKAPAGTDPRHIDAMMRALLAERFQLVAHVEQREQPVYELVRAEIDGAPGPRLRSRPDCANRQAGVDAQGKNPCGGFLFGPGRLTIRGMDIGAVASHLSDERIVIDRTGLQGDFDIDLEWTPDQMPRTDAALPPDVPRPRPDGASLVTALREQLGLRLQPSRALVEVLVIDRIEQPTAN
jgi:uncharacterized protein (TIGR03435 family)